MQEVREYIKGLDNKKLMDIITIGTNEYTEETVELAKEELEKRSEEPQNQGETIIDESELYNELILLKNVKSSEEAAVFQSLFEASNIPVMFKTSDGHQFSETDKLPIDEEVGLYVALRYIEDAKEILKDNIDELHDALYKNKEIDEYDSVQSENEQLNSSDNDITSKEYDNQLQINNENKDEISEDRTIDDDSSFIDEVNDAAKRKNGDFMKLVIYFILVLGAVVAVTVKYILS